MRPLTAGVVLLVTLPLSLAGCLGADEGLTDARSHGVPETAGPAGFSTTAVFPGTYATHGAFSRVLAPGSHGMMPAEAIVLPSDLDGTAISIGLVRPDVVDGVKVPVIVRMTPYLPTFDPQDPRRAFLGEPDPAFLIDNFVPHGYAVAFVAVRGTGRSGGCIDVMGPTETADLSQAVTWLGTQPWSNGAVGSIGLSYDGMTQWEVAGTGNPFLKTIVPMAGTPDAFSLVVRNGTPMALAVPGLPLFDYGVAGGGRATGGDAGALAKGTAEGTCTARAEAAKVFAEFIVTGERDASGWLAARDHRERVLANYRGSVLLVQGLRDHAQYSNLYYTGWSDALEARGIVVKHFVGQWHHSSPDVVDTATDPDEGGNVGLNPSRRWDWAEILLHWYDYWLKGDATRDLGTLVQVADSSGLWRSEASWPPADVRPLSLHLNPAGELGAGPSDGKGSALVAPSPTWMASPARSQTAEGLCPTCAVFESAPFDAETRIAGALPLHVAVTPQGPGGHLTAYLDVRGADGTLQRVGGAQMDLRFADGTEDGKPVKPGSTIVARMQLDPLDVVVPPGGTLVLRIGEGTFGEADAFFLTWYFSASPPAPVRLEVGGGQSTLTLPVIERGPEAFFEAPG